MLLFSYNVTNWLEKNKDPLNDTLVQVMKQSQSNKLLVEVWGDYTTQEEALAKSKSKWISLGKKNNFYSILIVNNSQPKLNISLSS